MGNGNLMVTLSGMPERLTFHLGKTDFWRDKCRDKKWWQSGNIPAGYLNLRPAGHGGGHVPAVGGPVPGRGRARC